MKAFSFEQPNHLLSTHTVPQATFSMAASLPWCGTRRGKWWRGVSGRCATTVRDWGSVALEYNYKSVSV